MANSVGNSVELSLFDVYTHEYFLSGAQILEEHEEAGDIYTHEYFLSGAQILEEHEEAGDSG